MFTLGTVVEALDHRGGKANSEGRLLGKAHGPFSECLEYSMVCSHVLLGVRPYNTCGDRPGILSHTTPPSLITASVLTAASAATASEGGPAVKLAKVARYTLDARASLMVKPGCRQLADSTMCARLSPCAKEHVDGAWAVPDERPRIAGILPGVCRGPSIARVSDNAHEVMRTSAGLSGSRYPFFYLQRLCIRYGADCGRQALS